MFSIFQDWAANKGNPKGRVVLTLFRIANNCAQLPCPLKPISWPYVIIYRIAIEWVLGIELPWKLKAGPGLRLFHGQGLVVNERAIIGSNCILRHNTTIGVAHTNFEYSGRAPVIGDNVDIGSNSVIIGNIMIGNFACIAAGSVVVKNVPEYCVVGGNPAMPIKFITKA